MIAVLIDSRKVGSSGWINVRSTQRIRVSGMQKGDHVRLHSNFPYPPEDILENEIRDLNGQSMVKAEIVKVSEESHIYVDLE